MGGNWVDSNDFESRGSCYVHVPDVCPPVDFAQHSRSMTATTTCYETGGATKINGMGSFIMNDKKTKQMCTEEKKRVSWPSILRVPFHIFGFAHAATAAAVRIITDKTNDRGQ